MSGGASAGPPDTSGMRPRRPWAGLASLLLLAIAAAFTPPLLADDAAAERLREPGAVLLIRHALAPGIGDPENFQLGDCATQRNLSDEGRQQARAIGRWLRSRGIQHARVYSSQWCRCLETAALLDLGPVAELPALNSFFENPAERNGRLAELQRFLAAQPRDGGLLVLVTHQVTISAVSGTFADSGTGVLMALGDAGRLERIGALALRGADGRDGSP
jgi:phosphohistidine phosphatase SixA